MLGRKHSTTHALHCMQATNTPGHKTSTKRNFAASLSYQNNRLKHTAEDALLRAHNTTDSLTICRRKFVISRGGGNTGTDLKRASQDIARRTPTTKKLLITNHYNWRGKSTQYQCNGAGRPAARNRCEMKGPRACHHTMHTFRRSAEK